MGFTHTTPAFNIYNEECGKDRVCNVCGSKWFQSQRNDDTQSGCRALFIITEWDGTYATVHAAYMGNDVHIVYQDGVEHIITEQYWHSLLPMRVYRT